MKILIVEDDSIAAEFIETMIRDFFPHCKVVGKVSSVKEASRLYNSEHPDLLVMDINLGDHNSFELFDYISPKQLTVVFTSSYQEYALKAIKVDAVDYLLKPINIDDFKSAIKKVEDRIQTKKLASTSEAVDKADSRSSKHGKILIYENGQVSPVDISNIVKVNSDGAYSKIIMKTGKVILSSKNLTLYEKLLGDKKFVRIHDSCLVNSEHILSYTPGVRAFVTLSDSSHENVSKRKKREFLEFYGS